MADFKCETVYLCDDFSPESYKKRYSLHTPRLFLLSRDMSESSDDSEDDAELEKSPFRENAKERAKDITSQEPEPLERRTTIPMQPVSTHPLYMMLHIKVWQQLISRIVLRMD